MSHIESDLFMKTKDKSIHEAFQLTDRIINGCDVGPDWWENSQISIEVDVESVGGWFVKELSHHTRSVFFYYTNLEFTRQFMEIKPISPLEAELNRQILDELLKGLPSVVLSTTGDEVEERTGKGKEWKSTSSADELKIAIDSQPIKDQCTMSFIDANGNWIDQMEIETGPEETVPSQEDRLNYLEETVERLEEEINRLKEFTGLDQFN